MSTFRDLVRAVQLDLPITMRMERWLLNNADPVWSEEALVFNDAHLRGKVGGNRSGRTNSFRASGLGGCARARVLARVDAPRVSEGFSSTQAMTFLTGNDYHRKWQRIGLTEGFLTEVEVPLYNAELDLGGTADGIIYDGSIFEFKSINDRGYDWVMRNREPEYRHRLQVAAYKLLRPESTKASIVYENKNTGEWREFRVDFTDQLVAEARGELAALRASVKTHRLPPVLSLCETKEGAVYRNCPFREICMKLHESNKTWLDEVPPSP